MRFTEHALCETLNRRLRPEDVLNRVFDGQVLDPCPRPKGVLIVGPSARFDLRSHVECEYIFRDGIVAIRTYLPIVATGITISVEHNLRITSDVDRDDYPPTHAESLLDLQVSPADNLRSSWGNTES